MTYKEWLSSWGSHTLEEFGLKQDHRQVQNIQDIDDLDWYEVIDEKLFFLAAIKYGFKYTIVNKP